MSEDEKDRATVNRAPPGGTGVASPGADIPDVEDAAETVRRRYRRLQRRDELARGRSGLHHLWPSGKPEE